MKTIATWWVMSCCLVLCAPAPGLAAGSAADLDASLYLRQCQPFFENLSNLNGRLVPAKKDSRDAPAARELQMYDRLAVEYLLDAKNMIAVWRATSGAAAGDAASDYIQAQLGLIAQKIDLDGARVEAISREIDEAELGVAGKDLLKIQHQIRDFVLETIKAAPAAQGGSK